MYQITIHTRKTKKSSHAPICLIRRILALIREGMAAGRMPDARDFGLDLGVLRPTVMRPGLAARRRQLVSSVAERHSSGALFTTNPACIRLVVKRMPPRKQHGSVWRAYGAVGCCVIEAHALLGQRVQVWCFHLRIACTAQHVERLLI